MNFLTCLGFIILGVGLLVMITTDEPPQGDHEWFQGKQVDMIVNPFLIAAGVGFGIGIIFVVIEDIFVKDEDRDEEKFQYENKNFIDAYNFYVLFNSFC